MRFVQNLASFSLLVDFLKVVFAFMNAEKEQIPLKYLGMYQLVVNVVVAHP